MTTATLKIRNSDDLSAAILHLGNMKHPFTLTTIVGEDRTKEQNRLVHKWFGEIAAQRGDVTSAEVKAECNLKYGMPIMQRDDPEWAVVFGHLFRGLDYEKKTIAIRVIDVPFTRRMKVKQLTEYMDQLYRDETARGVILTQPEDRK